MTMTTEEKKKIRIECSECHADWVKGHKCALPETGREWDLIEEYIKEMFYAHGDTAEVYDSHPYLFGRINDKIKESLSSALAQGEKIGIAKGRKLEKESKCINLTGESRLEDQEMLKKL